jgi:hypothetical protein
MEGAGGIYLTEGIGGTDYSAVGVYVGAPSGLEVFGQTEISTDAPNIEFGARAGIGELSVGVDAGPMVDSGGRALENIESNLYDFWGPNGPPANGF